MTNKEQWWRRERRRQGDEYKE